MCPGCGADLSGYLGTLGHTDHYRCRYCGCGYSRESEVLAAYDNEDGESQTEEATS